MRHQPGLQSRMVRYRLNLNHGAITSRSNGLRPHAVRIASAVAMILLLTGAEVVAQSGPGSNSTVPDSARDLFDLPWCKTWSIGCDLCSKSGDRITCKARAGCQIREDPANYVYCADFNAPMNCLTWSDGCNTCTRDGGRTTK